ncbi:secreted RxLR effector protein 161-like [Quercus robur]|uniref:secreted RxLR effector protein 161-like n=1 Tax=Quercus robur TaxID=38942 RepID=UPI0021611166|nr:secreted RxLR effector protein 161-like [Quercus robur]
MQNSQKGFLPFRHGVPLSNDQRPTNLKEENMMRQVPYASAVGSLMYAMLCTRPDICYSVGMVSRYQSNPGLKHWQAINHILKYLRRMRGYMLVYRCEDLIPIGYTDSNFQLDLDFRSSTSGYVFTLGGRAISWRSVKQSCIANSTMEADYVAACEVAKEVVWLKKFLFDLGVMRIEKVPITLFCDNIGADAQSKASRNHKKGKHIERKYHIILDIVARGDVVVVKIDGANKLANSFNKALPQRTFKSHVEGMGVRLVHNSL